MLIKLISWLLKRKKLSRTDRLLLLSLIQDKIDIIPIKDIIVVNGDRSISVNGVLLTKEQVAKIRESAQMVLNSHAFKFIHDQTTYEAIKKGIHTANDMDSILFGRAALWYVRKEIELLESISTLKTLEEIEQELNLTY